MTRILTLPETAKLLRCHISTLYRLLKRRQIPAFKIGSDYRVSEDDLVAWMRAESKKRTTTTRWTE